MLEILLPASKTMREDEMRQCVGGFLCLEAFCSVIWWDGSNCMKDIRHVKDLVHYIDIEIYYVELTLFC